MKCLSFLRAVVLSALAVFTSTAMHADTIYGLHLGSHHLPARDFNNFNPGAYVRWSNGITVGGYYNSERKTSAYVGYTYEWGSLAVTLGGITGYKRMAVLPMIVPSVKLGKINDATFRLAALPKLEKSGAAVLHLMVEF